MPLQTEPEPTGFDKVLRGYDPRQVDEYLDRVDAALTEADSRHAADGERLAALEADLEGLRARLQTAEHGPRAARSRPA